MRHNTHTLESLQKHAKSLGGQCLSSFYGKTKDKYLWKCSCGNEWYAKWNSILNGNWCKICRNKQNGINSRKFTIEDLKNFAINKGGKCLSQEYKNTNNKYDWVCEKNHDWSATWSDIRDGHWCYTCSREAVNEHARKYTIEDLQKLASKFKGKCLSNKYINIKTSYKWLCEKNHKFDKLVSDIEENKWCLECEEFDRIQQKGIEKKLTLLKVEGKITTWKCENKEHPSFIKIGSTLYSTLSCNLCEKEKRNTEKLKEIKKIAINKGGNCLSNIYEVGYKELDFICKEGHEWSTRAKYVKSDNSWCPECNDFKTEKEILVYIQQYYPLANKIRLCKLGIDSKQELDIYIPELALAIEYNGIFWHSEKFKDKNYHYNKYKLCKDNNITLIQIFEDEWLHRQDQVKNFLHSKLNLNNNKIPARKCQVKRIEKTTALAFINKYHIQKQNNCLVALGIFHKDELLGVLTGNKHHRLNNSDSLILSRLVFKVNTTIQGGLSKLLKYFKEYGKTEGYKRIITWSDLRYSEGKSYLKSGFEMTKQLKPDYSYMSPNINKRKSKQCCKKSNLSKEITNLTEKQLAEQLGLLRIYDCGKLRFEMDI